MRCACRHLGLIVLLGCLALTAGCATVTGSETQAINLETYEASGGAVAGADCMLSNNNGNWKATTPMAVVVRKSAEDLFVHCELENRPPGTARVISRVNAGMFGNVIVGGAIGAAIDHTKGTAYDYPDSVRIVFGADRVVDMGDILSSVPATAASAPPATAERPYGRRTSDERDARGTEALAMRAQRQAAQVADPPAAPGFPAAGVMWRYGFLDRQFRGRQAAMSVRIVRSSGTRVEEALTFGYEGVEPLERVVDASEHRFYQLALGANAVLVELSPYLLSAYGGNAPQDVVRAVGYPTAGAGNLPWNVSVRVRDWEPVAVPAGTFRALRLEIAGVRSGAGGIVGSGAIPDTVSKFAINVWYAPDVRRYVRLEHREWSMSGAPSGNNLVELVEFRDN